MAAFRVYLGVILACVVGYTGVVGLRHGWNLLPIFFSEIAALTWSGQFNVDFLSFLSLSALWVAWRHRFSAGGLALGLVAFLGGMTFLAPYLLWASGRAGGDVRVLLAGEARAAG